MQEIASSREGEEYELAVKHTFFINKYEEAHTILSAPKSGDITRCVNVVDYLGFPPVCVDNQQHFVDKTMI